MICVLYVLQVLALAETESFHLCIRPVNVPAIRGGSVAPQQEKDLVRDKDV
jgi:hypothetical protein